MSPAAAAFDVSTYLAREGAAAEEALERALIAGTEGLPSDLAEAIRHGVLGGGKRLRPVLCAAAFRAVGGRADDARIYDLAVCLELIHAYSLMHDDLPCMDNAELRRGRPATHRVHGVEVTTLAGAALIPMAVRQALTATRALNQPATTAVAVARELTWAAGAGGMVGGQVLDLEAEGRRLEPAALDTLHRLKTGALIRASLRIGALAGGAAAAVRERLDSFGRALGLAFQIADDVLDATASAGDLGKNPSDQARGKSTYVSLYGLDEARRRGADEIRRATEALDGAPVDATVLRPLAHFVTSRRR
jgi:geranylgeranyl pyrophosphate synthase